MKLLLMKAVGREEPDVNDVAGTAETSPSGRLPEHDTDLLGIHAGDHMPFDHRVQY
jgi:hypothetical protein